MTGISQRRLERILAAFSSARLLVVGDVMLDEYLWGDVERISQEAPVPVVHVTRESLALGGAGNVVRNVVALGGSCRFCGAVGDDAAGLAIVGLLKELGVDPGGLLSVAGRPTTHKTRVEARAQQVLRFDRETREPLSRGAVRGLLARIDAALPRVDAVILEDYAKGVLTRPIARAVIERCRRAGVPVYADPKADLVAFRGAALIKPNLAETEALTGVSAQTQKGLALALSRLHRRTNGAAVVVTRGPEGMTIFDGGAAPADIPTAPGEVFDKQGCGDTSIAALALALCAGASLLEAGVLANAAAGIVARKVGTATARPAEVRTALPAVLAATRRRDPRPASRSRA